MAIPKNSSKEQSKSVTGEKISPENAHKQNLIKPKASTYLIFHYVQTNPFRLCFGSKLEPLSKVSLTFSIPDCCDYDLKTDMFFLMLSKCWFMKFNAQVLQGIMSEISILLQKVIFTPLRINELTVMRLLGHVSTYNIEDRQFLWFLHS